MILAPSRLMGLQVYATIQWRTRGQAQHLAAARAALQRDGPLVRGRKAAAISRGPASEEERVQARHEPYNSEAQHRGRRAVIPAVVQSAPVLFARALAWQVWSERVTDRT